MKGIVVCVEYDDLLAITLPRMAAHLDRVVVVSSQRDVRTPAVVASVPNAELFVTEAFYDDGAAFNKGKAIEQGFDVLGRDGWLLVFDADIVPPPALDLRGISPGQLYNAPRRILKNPAEWSPDLDWATCARKHEPNEYPGYWQLFHASDAALRQRPWYPPTWAHAGGCDSQFMQRWPGDRKRYLPFEVLHLGEDGVNWHGRVTPRRDGEATVADAVRDERRRQQQASLRARRARHAAAARRGRRGK